MAKTNTTQAVIHILGNKVHPLAALLSDSSHTITPEQIQERKRESLTTLIKFTEQHRRGEIQCSEHIDLVVLEGLITLSRETNWQDPQQLTKLRNVYVAIAYNQTYED